MKSNAVFGSIVRYIILLWLINPNRIQDLTFTKDEDQFFVTVQRPTMLTINVQIL
jgi:hypothetical protein